MQAIGPNQEKWLQALESGEYVQCKENLGFIARDGIEDSGVEANCCLGVAGRVFGVRRVEMSGHDGGTKVDYCNEGEVTNGYAPIDVVMSLGLHSSVGAFMGGARLGGERSLAEANDAESSFAEIAAFCRAHPEAVFTEPR